MTFNLQYFCLKSQGHVLDLLVTQAHVTMYMMYIQIIVLMDLLVIKSQCTTKSGWDIGQQNQRQETHLGDLIKIFHSMVVSTLKGNSWRHTFLKSPLIK